MQPLKIAGAAIAILFVAAPAVVLGHHGWSSYEASNMLTITAPILESRYQNPHAEVVMADKGKKWLVTLAPPSRMQNRGVPPEAIAVGATVTVVGYPSRVETAELRAERIVIAGKTIELR